MRVFSVFAPDSRSLIFTKFIDIRVLSCWKACKNEVKGGCALRPAVFCKCLCGLLRAVLSGFYPLGVGKSHANGTFPHGSPWKARKATVRNSDGCMRLR